MEDLQVKVDNLKAQQEQARELFIKLQGGIEMCEALMKEEGEKKASKKDKIKKNAA